MSVDGKTTRRPRRVLITGGAGFVGSNVADRLLRDGAEVRILDSLARPGVEENVAWLRGRHGDRVTLDIADIRDAGAVREAARDIDQIFHFAAQVAVTTSVADPVADFEINLRGTLNVLEAARARTVPPSLLFASTNKVYGKLGDLAFAEGTSRYVPVDAAVRQHGVSERQPLDLYSPYGCSKGGADQYVLDYARIYGLRTAVFRMSCLYGPRQFGTEDQGWVAHFLISALQGRPITLYGDGKQVRDILFIDDAVEAFLAAMARIDQVGGRAYNLGGGPANAVSLIEVLDTIARLTGRRVKVANGAWRPGDQVYYVSDTRAFEAATGWRAAMAAADGIGRLHDWLCSRRGSTADAAAEEVPA